MRSLAAADGVRTESAAGGIAGDSSCATANSSVANSATAISPLPCFMRIIGVLLRTAPILALADLPGIRCDDAHPPRGAVRHSVNVYETPPARRRTVLETQSAPHRLRILRGC